MDETDRQRMIERLEARLPMYAEGFFDAVRTASRTREDIRERVALRRMWDLMIYATNVASEVVGFSLALARYPTLRFVWERYLILQLHEAIDSLPKLVAALLREVDAVGETAVIDRAALIDARTVYGKAVKLITGDREFMRYLRRVRDNVSAHHVGGKDADLSGLVEWSLSIAEELDRGVEPLESDLVMRALEFSNAVMTLGRASFNAFGWQRLPPIPSDAETYQAAVAAVDEALSS